MRSFLVFAGVIVCATAGSTGENSGSTGSSKPVGVGAYAYQDSEGNRYGGTYDIEPEDVQNLVYAPAFTGFHDFNFGGVPFGGEDEFFKFFNKLQSSFQDGFADGAGDYQGNMNNDFNNIGEQYAHAGMQYGQGFNMPDFMSNIPNVQNAHGGNSAFAGTFAGPDGTRQIASISPTNPNNPNIDISSRSGTNRENPGHYSVSSSSYASSSDVGGKKTQSRGAKTVVNDNGNIKKYEVHN